MTILQCFMKLLPLVLGVLVLFGIIYPALMIGISRLAGCKLTVREILRRI